MSKYDSWSKDDLAWKCRELEDKIEKLEAKLRKCEDEKYDLECEIETELKPRLEREKRNYDAWATSPERWAGYNE